MTEFPSRPIVVACPSFNETSGGTIVLHTLVQRLRELGADAYAMPWTKSYSAALPKWLRTAKRLNQWRKKRPFLTHPSMNIPIASPDIAREAIAVYPEIATGNPFGSPHVVRWLLHKPGYFGKDASLEEADLIFFYQHAFKENVPNIDPDNLLRVRWLRTDVYFDKGLARSGSCRMKRKGSLKGPNAVPSPDSSFALDGLSHEEIAKVFNETEVFYCHDAYTLYLGYAALCGCIPVVVPEQGVSSEAWRSKYAFKSGIAYGEEELEWAKATRNQLLDTIANQQLEESRNVVQFVEKLYDKFG